MCPSGSDERKDENLTWDARPISYPELYLFLSQIMRKSYFRTGVAGLRFLAALAAATSIFS